MNRSKNFIIFSSFILVIASLAAFFVWNNLKLKGEKTIPIAMALDEGYLYPTIVSITSMMENAKEDTIYDLYIMHPDEFSDDSKEKLNFLGVKYKNCNINLINMQKEYAEANHGNHITTPAYYRLSLSEILPRLDKMIWLDGDTLIFDDLREMYDLELNDNYYLACLDDKQGSPLAEFGLSDDDYVCDGVMVINLKKLRKDNMVAKYKSFIEEYNDKLIQHDQTVINAVCHGKIGVLPPRFGMFNYGKDVRKMYDYVDRLNSKNKYTYQEMDDALNNLAVLHCVWKPWKDAGASFVDTWWQYARKTDCYEEIYNKYRIF